MDDNISPILKSAIESFEHGLKHYIKNKPIDRKFAILHIDQAVELILKEKLVLKGEDIHKGNGESLNLHETFTKLDRKNIIIPEKPRIKEVHDIRNMVQHKGFTPDKDSTEYYIKIEYDFIKRFLKEEMGININKLINFKIIAFFEKYEPLPLKGQMEIAFDQINKNPSGAILDIFRSLEYVKSQNFPNENISIIIEKLRKKGSISESEYIEFLEAYKIRNNITHSSIDPSIQESKKVVEIVSKIIKSISDIDKINSTINIENFPEMIEDYLLELEINDYSIRTIDSYKSIISNFYKFLLKEEEITNERRLLKVFKKYINFLKREKDVSQNYIRLITTTLQKFLIFHNINALEEFKLPKREKTTPESLNEQEIKDLFNIFEMNSNFKTVQAEITNLRNKLILTLLYSPGLKASELVDLRISNLNLHNRSIITIKDGKEQIKFFDESTKTIITEYLKKRNNESEFLFINRSGKHLSSRYIQQMIKNYAKEAGIKKNVTPSVLKRSFESYLRNSTDFNNIKNLLERSNINTT